MSSATRPNNRRDRSPKRVRTDDSATVIDLTGNDNGNKKQPKSPTRAAEMALESTTASLPDSLRSITQHFGRKIIDIRSKLHNKRSIYDRMSKEEAYVPRSAKATEFKISVSRPTADAAKDRLEFLEAQVQQAKETYEKSLKAVVQECTQLEITTLERLEQDITADFLHGLAQAIDTLEGITDVSPHLKTATLLATNGQLWKYSPSSDTTEIRDHYKERHGINDLPIVTLHPANGNYSSTDERAAAQRQAALSAQRRENKGFSLFAKGAEAVLVLPTKVFNDQHATNQKEIAVRKLTTSIIEGKTTEETAMELDNEGGTTLSNLQGLINQEVTKRLKHLQTLERKYEALERRVQSSNTPQDPSPPKNQRQRGQKGASDKKKSPGKPAQTQAKPGKQRPKAKSPNGADASVKDTSNVSSNKPRNKTKQRSRSRNRRSKTNSNRS